MAKTIDTLIAESEIRDLQMRYCRAADRMDFDLFRTCFHPDATFDYAVFQGGLDDFIAMGRESLKRFVGTVHFTGNQLIEVDGDTAWAEHYTVATHRIAADGDMPMRDYVTSIRYVDHVDRRNGVWKISKRTLLLDLSRTDAVADLSPLPRPADGARDRTDPSYIRR
jgi:hypothetical protein